MKYIFIANPNAGNKDAEARINNELKALKNPIDYEIYSTKGKLDATNFVVDYSKAHEKEEVCFVACGGDGTLNEVATGIMGTTNKYLGILAYGSGNDFVKYYKGHNFINIQNLVDGEPHKIDILKVTDNTNPSMAPRYSINVCNFGLDAVVCAHANKLKDAGKKHAYTRGVLKAILVGRYNDIQVEVEGEVASSKKMLLCTLANCHYVGGSYFTAPKALNDDGIIDVCLYRTMPLLKFASLEKLYQTGHHLEEPCLSKTKKELYFKKTKGPIRVHSKKQFDICLDGEVLPGTDFNVTIVPSAINFIIPTV